MNFQEEETTLVGTIEHIIYHNDENGYSVFLLGGEDEIICTGSFLVLEEGLYVKVTGHEIEHPKYGFQFQVTSMEEKEPEDALSIERYLASGSIKGIGPKTARNIVNQFGDDTLRIMEEEPERLAEIRGISERKAREIYLQIEATRGQRDAMMFLQKYNISNNLAVKIYDRYKSDLFRILKENPYRISEDIDGIGFKRADDIALSMGFEPDSEYRINYCILDTLKKAADDGHMYLPSDELYKRSSMLLGFKIPGFDDFISNLSMERKVVLKELKINDEDQKKTLVVYYNDFYYTELNTATILHALNGSIETDENVLKDRIKIFEEKNNIELDSLQSEGVIEACKNNIFILTGGPGTGKTTTIRAIINMFELEGMDITLCAPTGRAARRMTQATGYPSTTIHRLLEVQVNAAANAGLGRTYFAKGQDNPIETDVIIVDEMSMVDIQLMYALLKAIIPGTHLILIGDTSQLPSVGPGLVLKDMIDSGSFKSLELTQIFRQDEESDIVINAHKIDKGENVLLDNKSKDFFFIKQTRPISVQENMKILIGKKLPPYTGAKPCDIQVLTPTKKGPLGTLELNRILQQYLNPPHKSKDETEYHGTTFRCGDKVMQIKNNYQLVWEIYGKNSIVVEEGTGVFNGDMGVITKVDKYFEEITVLFDDMREVKYPFIGLDELELAYALTVHKSQGSEYPVVIIPLLAVPPLLRYRNLLYTAVTRAKTHVVIMGDQNVFYEMIKNEKEQKRYSALKTYIKEAEFDF